MKDVWILEENRAGDIWVFDTEERARKFLKELNMALLDLDWGVLEEDEYRLEKVPFMYDKTSMEQGVKEWKH